MDLHRDILLDCLKQHCSDDVGLVSDLQLLLAQHGQEAARELFHILTALEMDGETAEHVWPRIIEHWENLCGVLGRKVSLRTALCDYFCSIDRSLHNPKMIELDLFEQIDQRSKYDNLTHLFNRHYFDDVLEREVARANRHNGHLSLLLLDLDDFKKVNDAHGHPVGDKVLQHIAGIILAEKRTEDIATRHGGEELAIIMPDTDKAEGVILAERIRKKVEDHPLRYNHGGISVTLSGGVASLPADASGVKDLIRKTDSALYAAKASGKNTIKAFTGTRRRHQRIEFREQVLMETVSPASKTSTRVYAKNLSAGGLLLASPTRLKTGAELKISLSIRPATPLSLTGKVVRIETWGTDSHDIGVRFQTTPADISEEISHYVLNRLAQNHINSASGAWDVAGNRKHVSE